MKSKSIGPRSKSVVSRKEAASSKLTKSHAELPKTPPTAKNSRKIRKAEKSTQGSKSCKIEDKENIVVPKATTEDLIDFQNAKLEKELNKWRKTFDILIAFMSKNSKLSFNQPKTDFQKRALAIELCKDICQSVENPKNSEKYRKLQERYNRQKMRHKRLLRQTEYLMEEVSRNRQILNKYLDTTRSVEQSNLERSLAAIESILNESSRDIKLDVEVDETLVQMESEEDSSTVSPDIDFDISKIERNASKIRKSARRIRTSPLSKTR